MKNRNDAFATGSNTALVVYFIIFGISVFILVIINGTKPIHIMVMIIVSLLSIIGTKIALVLFTYLVEKEWYYDEWWIKIWTF